MKTRNNDKAAIEENAKSSSLSWQLIALFLPVAIIAMMLTSVVFIKNKLEIKCYVSNSISAGDVAVFVAMPLLNAAVK